MDKNYETVHLIGTLITTKIRKAMTITGKPLPATNCFQTATVKETGKWLDPLSLIHLEVSSIRGFYPRAVAKFTARQYPRRWLRLSNEPPIDAGLPGVSQGSCRPVKYINKLNNLDQKKPPISL